MVDAERGLGSAEVAEREARGQVNLVPRTHTRTVAQIVRSNVFTRFNALLGAMLAIILVVGPLQDALFGFVLVVNAAVGIVQELRAKRTLDRLSVLTAPKAHVVREGRLAEVPVDAVVLDDVLQLSTGMQVVVDGEVLSSDGLELDESLLTGEADPVAKAPGDGAMSGSFVAAGAGRMVATAVGTDAYAVKLALEARRFTLARSELRDGVNQILRWVTFAIVPTAALLFISQLRHHDSWRDAVSGAVAGTVAMVPEGLVLLMSVAFAVAVLRLARRNVLVQELPAVEGLARVDVLCIDKTGTLTAGKLAVVSVETLDGEVHVEDALAAIAGADEHPNATMAAIGERYPTVPSGWSETASVPFSSARKWSAVTFGDRGSWVVGGADVLIGADDDASSRVADATAGGARVLVLARADGQPQDGRLPSSVHRLSGMGLEPVRILPQPLGRIDVGIAGDAQTDDVLVRHKPAGSREPSGFAAGSWPGTTKRKSSPRAPCRPDPSTAPSLPLRSVSVKPVHPVRLAVGRQLLIFRDRRPLASRCGRLRHGLRAASQRRDSPRPRTMTPLTRNAASDNKKPASDSLQISRSSAAG